VALDVQREQLLAERRTFGELPQLLGSPNDSVSSQALRSLAFSPEMASNPAVARLTQQLIENQTKLDSLTYGSAPTNPDLARLRATFRSTKQELLGAVASQIRSLDARINAVTTLRQRSGAFMQTLPALEAQEMRLQEHVEALSTMGDHLRQESQKAQLAEAAEVGDMQIMDLADVPYSSTWPAGWLKLGLGLLAGLLLGGAGSFLLEMNDTSIRRPEELEEELRLSGVAIIPRVPAADRNGQRPRLRFLRGGKNSNGWSRPPAVQSGSPFGAHPGQSQDSPQGVTPSPRGLVTLSQPRSIGTEAFRMLRTNLIWSDWGKELKTILITSVVPGEGKTLTAANLAVIFARGGMRVLMVDGDLRRAGLHKIFRMPRGPGLTELIKSYGGARQAVPGDDAALPVMNGDELRSQIRKTALDGLYLLPAGIRSRLSETFGDVQVRSLLRELSDLFDLVVIDAPPVLASADAAILASMTDGVLLVIRAGRTGRGAIQHAYQQLIKVGARVVGTVLNDPQGVLKEVEEYYYPYEYVEARD
jgi:capsular exopolysaccharide synthesis family protein